MIKFNGCTIDTAEQAKEFVDSCKSRIIRCLIAYVLFAVWILFLQYGWNEEWNNNFLIILFGLHGLISILIIGKDKLLYLLSSIKRAWLYGWRNYDSIVVKFCVAYLCAGMVISYIASAYFIGSFVGITISIIEILVTYFRCKKI